MPMDRSRYPADWDAIARARKDASDWTCDACGKPCRQPGETFPAYFGRVWDHAFFRAIPANFLWAEMSQYPQRFTLTVAHTPDPDPLNVEPDNLRALCAPCHCRLDAPLKAERRRQKEMIP